MKYHDRGVLWKEVTFVTAVYIPELSGYWKESLDVLKVCLESLQRDRSIPFDLMVINNGSCLEVRQYLESLFEQQKIQFLINSEYNLGKGGALNFGLASAPGKYLAYSDCDVLFRPGWLKESLEVIAAFPQVGMVTARPNRSKKALQNGRFQATFAQLKSCDAKIRQGRIIDQDILNDHARSVGFDSDFEDFDCDDTLVEFEGHSAYVGAYHFQFLTSKEAATQILPLEATSSLSTCPDHAWDQRMNDLGYSKFTITKPLCRHLGNTLQGETAESLLGEPSAMNRQYVSASHQQSSSWLVKSLRFLMKIPKVRGLYTHLYKALFEVIS